MCEMQKVKIAFIGSGNVAWHLAKNFSRLGHPIVGISSRNVEGAKKLALEVGSQAKKIFDLDLCAADLVFLCVPDKAIYEIAQNLDVKNACVVHTSGATHLGVLDKFNNKGVFYPFNTFSKRVEISLDDTPIFVESPTHEKLLSNLAKSFSKKVHVFNSKQRLQLHIAGTLVNNFVNHILAMGENFMGKNEIDYHLLQPLIERTFSSALKQSPSKVQSGPASRNDRITIEKHRAFLKDHTDLNEIYHVLTNSILKKYGYEKLD